MIDEIALSGNMCFIFMHRTLHKHILLMQTRDVCTLFEMGYLLIIELLLKGNQIEYSFTTVTTLFPKIIFFVALNYRPPLWSSGRSSWLHIQSSGFDSRRYQIFSEAAGLERGPLNLVITTEELLERKSSGSGLENRKYGRRDPSR
jgi:hypothetical protein